MASPIYTFNGWDDGADPVALFDTKRMAECLHATIQSFNVINDPGLTQQAVADTGLVHELAHLASGVPICTHRKMHELRAEIVAISERVGARAAGSGDAVKTGPVAYLFLSRSGEIRLGEAGAPGHFPVYSEKQPLPQGEIRLWDSQWVNIVNHDHCWANYSKEDAVTAAVKMTEKAIASNVADRKMPQPKIPNSKQSQSAESRCDTCNATGDAHRPDGEYVGRCTCQSVSPKPDSAASDYFATNNVRRIDEGISAHDTGRGDG